MLVAMTKFLDLLYQINFTLHYITISMSDNPINPIRHT